jgi:hypothetical protein
MILSVPPEDVQPHTVETPPSTRDAVIAITSESYFIKLGHTSGWRGFESEYRPKALLRA